MLFCAILPQEGHAQDPRYSQFYAAPQDLNPALVGVIEGQFRFTANYREQYNSLLGANPFRTISAGYDMRLRAGRYDYFGWGVTAQRDEAGRSHFKRMTGNMGFSYMKQLDGGGYRSSEQFLVAGAQLGAGQHRVDWSDLWFSNQFNTEFAYVDPDVASGENFVEQTTNIYVNFNAGLLYYAVFEDNRSVYFGAAYHHLNEPNVSFLDNAEENLQAKWVAHAGGELPFSDNLSMLPAIAVMGQGSSMSTTLGANFRYTNRDWREVALRMGLWGHVSNKLESGMAMDAVIIAAILEMERWNVGLSYDLTASSLATANNARGAFEVSLIYVHPSKSRRFKVNCPKF